MVKDLKDFLEKIKEDKALQERLGKIVKESVQENVFANCSALAAELGYTITPEDMQAYMDEYQADLSDKELDKVTGGTLTTIAASILLDIFAESNLSGWGVVHGEIHSM